MKVSELLKTNFNGDEDLAVRVFSQDNVCIGMFLFGSCFDIPKEYENAEVSKWRYGNDFFAPCLSIASLTTIRF
jgi:hypothetical protein